MSELAAMCGECKTPIGAGEGHLGIDVLALAAYRAAAAEWQAANPSGVGTMGSLLDHPEQVPWKLHHFRCEASPCGYGISVEEITSFKSLVKWTAHLMGKGWLGETDWDELLEQVAEGAGDRLAPTMCGCPFKDEDIALVRRLNPLADVIVRTVDLASVKYNPPHLLGRCPFCSTDDTLRVVPEPGFWTCDSCRLHGDVIAWTRKLHNLDFNTAVQALAVRAGVPLNREATP